MGRRQRAATLAPAVEALEPLVMLSGSSEHSLDMNGLGFELVDEPEEVAPGIWFLGTGPSPDQLRLIGLDNVNAADSTNADQLQPGGSSGLDLDGTGITVGVWDGGQIRDTHQELVGKITYGDGASGLSDHATHVTGTIAATGINPAAAGMSPGVDIIGYDFGNDTAEIAAAVANGLIDLSNHSYGLISGWTIFNWGFGNEDTWFENRGVYDTEDTTFGKYDSSARAIDQIHVDNPHYLSVWSAGNDRGDAYSNFRGDNTYVAFFSSAPTGGTNVSPGWYRVATNVFAPPGSDGNGGTGYDTLSGDKNAKNNLVVGAVQDVLADPYDPGSVVTTSFSGYGPTDDGRVKPDVVGNGASLLSSSSASNTAYNFKSGTSMSAPNVTGTTALLIEHYNNLYGNLPIASTTKGALIHNATDVGNFGPDYATGWGLVDAARTADFLTTAATTQDGAFLEDAIYAGTTLTFEFVSDGSGPLKASIVWTDLPGAIHSAGLDVNTPVLVNDLDLTISGPDGTTYMPWTLDPSNPNSPAVRTAANHLDNVEQVLIDVTTAGVYTVTISAAGNFTQPVSLLVSGFDEAGAGSSISGVVYNDLDGSGSRNGGEPGLQGRIVYIDENGNGVRDRRTDMAYGSGLVSQTIFDRRTVLSPITIQNVPSTSLTDVTVTLRIGHSYTRDLDIFLIGPDGTRVELATDAGLVIGQGYIGTTFDDAAATSVVDGNAPFAGSYRPEGSLYDFDGIDPNGVWTLEVTDDAAGDRGNLVSWSVNIVSGSDEVFTTTDVNGQYTFDVLDSGTYSIGTELPAGWEQTEPAGGINHLIVLAPAEDRTNVNFGTRLPVISLSGGPMASIFGRASTGTTVILESNGTAFVPRYAHAPGVWSGVLPVGLHWNELLSGDFNNDGLDDLAGLSKADGKWRVLLGSPDGLLAPQEWGMWSTNVSWDHLMVGDYNGDGFDDVASRASSGTWVAALSDGTQFNSHNFGAWSMNVTWQDVHTGDVDGDGRTDIIGRASTGTWVAGISNSGEFAMQAFGSWVTTVGWTKVVTADLNGDGLTDVLGRSSTGTWVGSLSDGTQFTNLRFGAWSAYVGWTDIHIADFNGDGMDDVVGKSSTGRIVVGISNGAEFTMAIWTNFATSVSWQTVVGDFDGDGRADIAGRASSGSWWVGISQGNTFNTTQWGAWSTGVDWDNIHSGVFV